MSGLDSDGPRSPVSSPREIWCDKCNGVRVEQLSFADASKRVTHRLARYVHDLCKMMTMQNVADNSDRKPDSRSHPK